LDKASDRLNFAQSARVRGLCDGGYSA